MRLCPNCGAQISDQDVFCGECGVRLSDEPAAPVDVETAATDVVSKEAVLPGRKFPLAFVVVGGVAVLIALCICGVLVFLLSNRSAETSEPVFLGGESVTPETSAPSVGAPASEPIFEETFNDNTQDWYVWKDEHGEKGVEDGVYYIAVTDTEWASWGTSGDLTFADGVIEVEAWAAEGPDDNGYGLVFRYQGNENFYYFEVSSDGYYTIGKMTADEWETLVGWTESDLIRLGSRTNTLRVECDGPQMTFFVNDYQIEALTDFDFEAGSVGFMAEAGEDPGVTVHFDNLKVWAAE